MTSAIVIFILSLMVVIAAGHFLVKGASGAALKLNLSPMVVGLTIVAFGTSAPELFISIKSALSGSPDIAMGNVVGSNICNLGLVLGVAAVMNPIVIQQSSLRIDWPVAMGSGVLLYLLVRNGVLHSWEGGIFLLILSLYLYFTIKKSRKDTLAAKRAGHLDIPQPISRHLWKDLAWVAASCVGLYFGSDRFVESAKVLAQGWGISERIIGLTMVAVGTSLPELVTSIIAAIKKQTDLALGNLVGSNIFNILSILGITSLIESIPVSGAIIHLDIVWMLGITFIILPIMLTQKVINRWEGAVLLLIYGYYMYSIF